MKAGLLNGQVKGNLGQTKPAPSGEKPVTIVDLDLVVINPLLVGALRKVVVIALIGIEDVLGW